MTTLDGLVETFQEEKVVERIIDADDKESIVKSMKEIYKESLNDFHSQDVGLYDGFISTENAVQICVICMMAEVDDYEVLWYYEELPKVLHQVTGRFEKVAKRMEFFLLTGKCFSDYDLMYLIEKFFTNKR